jgi:cytochrome c oxidase subunit 2
VAHAGKTESPSGAYSNLGPGFWTFTVILVLAIIASDIWLNAQNFSDWVPEAATPADKIDDLFKFMGLCLIPIWYIVTGYTVYFAIVFRKKKDMPDDAIGVQVHGHVMLEFWWTAIPTVLVIVLAIYSVQIWQSLQNAQGDVLTMEAIGHQFGFQFRYPKLNMPVSDDMHIPVGTPVTLHITSIDVLHSFWVPEVRLKADMVPGLIQTLRFTPTKVGTYRIICTEYCGRNHGLMVGKLMIDTPDDFQKWLDTTAKAQGAAAAAPLDLSKGQADAGQALFGQKCSACHSVGPFTQKIVGPGLGHLEDDPANAKLVDGDDPSPANIAKILQNGFSGPIGTMPNQTSNAISNLDIANLVAYLVSLSGKK